MALLIHYFYESKVWTICSREEVNVMPGSGRPGCGSWGDVNWPRHGDSL
jgi:hypothetical protein